MSGAAAAHEDGEKKQAGDGERSSGQSSGEGEKSAGGDGEGQQQGGDEEQQGGPPTPVGFWDHRLKHVRHEAFRKWTLTTAILMAFIIGFLSIYWAVFFEVEQNLSRLVVYVVDLDGAVAPYENGVEPFVGPQIIQLAQQQIGMPGGLGYTIMQPSDFDSNTMRVRQAVYDWDAWAAIIVNPNATALLQDAVQNGNASYEPQGACQLVYQSGRDNTNWNSYLSPPLTQFMTSATSTVGQQWTQRVLDNATTDSDLLTSAAQAPQALSPAIGFSQYDLRPFAPPTTLPAVSIGLIYLIIVSFFSFLFYLPIHFKYLKPEGHPPLKFYQLILWRWCSTLSAYFMLSLAYSLISLAFQVNFAGNPTATSETLPVSTGNGLLNAPAYGHGTFVVYWILNFWGMVALGLASENVSMIVGQPWTGLWLIFWVITNVSTGFYDIDIEPIFYRWGYGWPLHYVVEGSRHILFDVKGHLGRDFGVLIAWAVVNTVLFPFACWFMRWKSKHHVHEYYK